MRNFQIANVPQIIFPPNWDFQLNSSFENVLYRLLRPSLQFHSIDDLLGQYILGKSLIICRWPCDVFGVEAAVVAQGFCDDSRPPDRGCSCHGGRPHREQLPSASHDERRHILRSRCVLSKTNSCQIKSFQAVFSIRVYMGTDKDSFITQDRNKQINGIKVDATFSSGHISLI